MPDYARIDEALTVATERLRHISDSARLEAELLLARALDVERSYLFGHPEATLDTASVERFGALIERRSSGMPLAYITGEKEFWSLNLMVTPDTLIPRPETEILVQEALKRIDSNAALRILDLGTGSGAIALALATERPACQVVATDFSEAAVAVARQNARQLQLGNVDFVQGDWIEPVVGETFDLVVSNPPYLQSGDPALESLEFEPAVALLAGDDGLSEIRVIARDSRPLLPGGGTLLLEHGWDQQQAVAAILQQAGWSDIQCTTDLAGQPRVSIALSPG